MYAKHPKELTLVRLQGNTYYIPASTITGVYVFSDHTCLLIDSAASQTMARRIGQFLQEQGLNIRGIFNTHAHGDHTSGNQILQNLSQCAIYAAPEEAFFIAYPRWQAEMLYTANPPRFLQTPLLVPKPSKVTHLVQPGPLTVNEVEFEVLPLPGHTQQHCGLRTPDGVCFTGDALIDPEILAEHPFLYLSNIPQQRATLEALPTLLRINQGPEFVITAHAGPVKNLDNCIKQNKQLLLQIQEDYLHLLQMQACSQEEIVQWSLEQYRVHPDIHHYFMASRTVSAYLSYLSDQGCLRPILAKGRVAYKAYQLS